MGRFQLQAFGSDKLNHKRMYQIIQRDNKNSSNRYLNYN